METYTAMRQFADSWGLLFMCLFFVGVVLWAMAPARKADAERASQIPFKDYADADPDYDERDA
jgi:cytochrome c oxidase cbb3-type subunit 4